MFKLLNANYVAIKKKKNASKVKQEVEAGIYNFSKYYVFL